MFAVGGRGVTAALDFSLGDSKLVDGADATDLSWSVAGMNRNEPILVPEWLKGTSGGSASGGASHDNLSAFHSGSSERPLNSSSRRGLSKNSWVSDHANTVRDPLVHSRAYASFRRSSTFRSHDALEREKDWGRERDWEMRDREKFMASGGNECRSHKRLDAQRWSTSGSVGRFENESTISRSRSVISSRNVENGAKKFVNELGSITALPVQGSPVSNTQKAAFEKNFPCLGAEEKQGTVQSTLANVSTLNSPIWQVQGLVGKQEAGRVSSPALTISAGSTPSALTSGGSVIGVDGWKSALADAPVSNEGVRLSNGLSTTVQQIATRSSISSKGHGPRSTSGLNMAEALVQNPPYVRSPQLSIDAQRMEELVLKQSRQLIPMTPAMPKTMGPSPSEKSKMKTIRSIDTAASVVKSSQPIGSSHILVSPKLSPGGKFLVLKPAREIGASMSIKFDGSAPLKGGNIGSNSFGALAGDVSLAGRRKQKLPSDHRAVPSSSMVVSAGLDGGQGSRSKESSLAPEAKKPVSQAQNRSDFFNALRRKAYENSTLSGTQEKSGSSTMQKTDEGNGKEAPNSEDEIKLNGDDCVEKRVVNSYCVRQAVEIESSEKRRSTLNGFILGEIDTTVNDTGKIGNPGSSNTVSVKVGSEEEEVAFLRSLGWEENAGGEEGLTEEEINSFYEEHMTALTPTNAFRRVSHRLLNLRFEMHVGNVESLSSGLGLSDSV